MNEKKTENIRSKQGSNQTVRLDLLCREELKHLKKYWLRAANHDPSNTVLVRRAVDIYTVYVDSLEDPSEELLGVLCEAFQATERV